MQIVVKFNDSMVTQVESDKSEVTIGRDPEADIQIDNISVSRIHAKIEKHQRHIRERQTGRTKIYQR
jgi:pSer/pThr/pTyr-binding forkhead associated (FHA) protein